MVPREVGLKGTTVSLSMLLYLYLLLPTMDKGRIEAPQKLQAFKHS